MNFEYSSTIRDVKQKRLDRFFAVLPGLTSWSVLLGMLILCFRLPYVAAVGIIAFDIYWILRLFYMLIFLVIARWRLSLEQNTDWMARLEELAHWITSKNDDTGTQKQGWRQKVSRWLHGKKIKELRRAKDKPPAFTDIYHLVIIPVMAEIKEVVRPGVVGLTRASFPAKQMVVVVALEARACAAVKAGIAEILKEFHGAFFHMVVIEHPDGLPGEARVKGANIRYAAQQMPSFFEMRKIPFDQVIVSCFDADTVAARNYFACLTYQYLTCPKRTRASYQPIPVFNNNIWESHSFARILEMGSSFFQLIEATNPEKLVTFSSHSMSFKALVEVGYWPADMISDDSAIFWKAYLHYKGDYRVVPVYETLSMDVADAPTPWQTVCNVYKQKRRWAWGIENFPILMRGFIAQGEIRLYDKIRHAFKMFESHVSWASSAFLLTLIGWLPAVAAGHEFSNTVMYYSIPRITSLVFHLSSVAVLVSIGVSWSLLPRRKRKVPFLQKALFALEWFFVPVVFTLLSALPALDAQTRLMLGKRMEFWVTPKTRG